MSDVIKYPLSAAIELCEQLDNDQTNYYLKMLEYKRERDEAREAFVIATDQMVVAQCKLREAKRERDEARFLLKQAQSALDAIHLEVGGWIKIMKEKHDN
jgi:uncharacterized coiled-coil DUF342 family protein